MNKLNVSTRLCSIVGVATLIMFILCLINWVSLSRPAELQNPTIDKAHAASQIRHDANLGAQAYNVVADPFINQQFAEAAKKWDEINMETKVSVFIWATKSGAKP